jgi:predicted nucleic acid-binding protein
VSQCPTSWLRFIALAPPTDDAGGRRQHRDRFLDRVAGREHLDKDELVAPPLLWSEVPSVLHDLRFRGEISDELAEKALLRLLENSMGLTDVRPEGLTRTAWKLAPDFGWAKTYEAEHVAAAQLMGCRLGGCGRADSS